MKQYRLSLDDNIWVFRDLARDCPASIFDHPYLFFLREAHRRFGTKIQLNVYLETKGFSLSQMPDTWKGEWRENAHWLRLSFHSRGDEPPKPYESSGYDEVYRDCKAVCEEIRRFAGEEALSMFTTIHFTLVSPEGVKALYDGGIRGLVGLFGTNGEPRGSYSLSESACRMIREKRIGADLKTGMWYFCNDLVLNTYPLTGIRPALEDCSQQDFIEVMIHEQYFHPCYFGYQPDYRDKVFRALEWLDDRGYEPAFLEEVAGLRSAGDFCLSE